MKISHKDAILIKIYLLKGYGARSLLSEFPNKGSKTWKHRQSAEENLQDGYNNCQAAGSSKPRSASSDDNIKKVEDLVLSQKDKPKRAARRSAREISHETDTPRSSVHGIIHRDH